MQVPLGFALHATMEGERTGNEGEREPGRGYLEEARVSLAALRTGLDYSYPSRDRPAGKG